MCAMGNMGSEVDADFRMPGAVNCRHQDSCQEETIANTLRGRPPLEGGVRVVHAVTVAVITFVIVNRPSPGRKKR
jgi:hypothetical protein